MIREERIDKAATEFAKVSTEIGVGIDATKYRSFIDGANWADSHKYYTEREIMKIISVVDKYSKEEWFIAMIKILRDLNEI